MTPDDPLARVYGYPYPAGEEDEGDPPPPSLPAGMVPVLAFGANASRTVLQAKLGDAGTAVTALAVELRGADVVYSAHVSPYGAIPATLHPSPGTVVAARLLLVETALLARLDATEPNYVRAPFGEVEVRGLGAVGAHAYRSRHGALHLGGAPVALEGVGARGRSLRALGQRDVQAAARDLLEPGTSLDGFVLAAVGDPAVRARRTEFLRGLREPAQDGDAQG